MNDEINEILNIDVTNNVGDKEKINLNIDDNVNFKTQDAFRDLFKKNYLEPDRPDDPKTFMELKIKMREHNIFQFSPRRLSFAEKEKL